MRITHSGPSMNHMTLISIIFIQHPYPNPPSYDAKCGTQLLVNDKNVTLLFGPSLHVNFNNPADMCLHLPKLGRKTFNFTNRGKMRVYSENLVIKAVTG